MLNCVTGRVLPASVPHCGLSWTKWGNILEAILAPNTVRAMVSTNSIYGSTRGSAHTCPTQLYKVPDLQT